MDTSSATPRRRCRASRWRSGAPPPARTTTRRSRRASARPSPRNSPRVPSTCASLLTLHSIFVGSVRAVYSLPFHALHDPSCYTQLSDQMHLTTLCHLRGRGGPRDQGRMIFWKQKPQPCLTNLWKALVFGTKEGPKRPRKREEEKEQRISAVVKLLKSWVMLLYFLLKANLRRPFLFFMRSCELRQIYQIHISYLVAFMMRLVN